MTTTPLGICLKFMLGRGRPVCFQQPAAVTSMTEMKAHSRRSNSSRIVSTLLDDVLRLELRLDITKARQIDKSLRNQARRHHLAER